MQTSKHINSKSTTMKKRKGPFHFFSGSCSMEFFTLVWALSMFKVLTAAAVASTYATFLPKSMHLVPVSSIQNHLPLTDIWRKQQICFKLVFSPNPMIWSASSDTPDHPSIPTGWPKILPSSEAKGATVTGHCALKIKCKISYNWLLSFLFQ